MFATIGLRNQGWAITSKSTEFADFAAFADVDADVLGANLEQLEKRTGRKADGYKDYRKVLERDDVDAVMIATPDHWHTKIAVEAMLAGKDVYCEKPLTLTIAEGKLIERVVEETGRVFQVGTMQRTESDQRFLKAIALIRDGRIGEVRKVTCGIGGATGSPEIPAIAPPAGAGLGDVARPGSRSGLPRPAADADGVRRRRAALHQLPLRLAELVRVLRRPDERLGAPTTSTSRPGPSARTAPTPPRARSRR